MIETAIKCSVWVVSLGNGVRELRSQHLKPCAIPATYVQYAFRDGELQRVKNPPSALCISAMQGKAISIVNSPHVANTL